MILSMAAVKGHAVGMSGRHVQGINDVQLLLTGKQEYFEGTRVSR